MRWQNRNTGIYFPEGHGIIPEDEVPSHNCFETSPETRWCRRILAENRCSNSNDFRIIHANKMENEQSKHRPLCFRGRPTQWHYGQACGTIGSTGNLYGRRKTKSIGDDVLNQVV